MINCNELYDTLSFTFKKKKLFPKNRSTFQIVECKAPIKRDIKVFESFYKNKALVHRPSFLNFS